MFLWPLPTEAGLKQRQVWPDPLTLALSGGLSHQAGLTVLHGHPLLLTHPSMECTRGPC